MIIPDISQFVFCLWEPSDIVEVRCLLNGDSRRFWQAASELPGLSGKLAAMNDAGWNIYIGIAPRPAHNVSGDANIKLCRALFCDFDGQHLNGSEDHINFVREKVKAVGLPVPTMTVFSGHGIHTYWRLAEPLEPARWKKANTRLSAILGSDSTVCNCERIMRLPGLVNNKPPAAPCVIVEHDPARTYNPADFAALKEPEKRVEPTAPMPVRTKPASDQAARAAAYAATWERRSEGEGRNQALYRHIKALVNDMQIPADIARQTVVEWNQGNSPPLSDRELGQTITDALKYANKKPAGCKNNAEPKVKRADETDSVRPVYVWMKDIEAKPVSWLWQDRVPSAMLSLFIGLEGSGKTFCALDVAARVTTARPLPGGIAPYDIPPVGNVVFLTSEDHLNFTIRPRLDAMKADPARIAALKGVTYPKGNTDFFDVMRHLPALETLIQEASPVRLLIVDPLTAFLGATDQHKNGEVRVALARFNALAEKYGCAIIGISHLSKDISRAAIHRTIGSVAFSAAARAVWLISVDRDEPKRVLFVPVKMNLAPMAKSLAFRIEGMALQWEEGQFDYEADDVLAANRDEHGALADAREWLSQALTDGRVRSEELKKMGKKEGIAPRTLERAKSKLRIVSEKEGISSGAVWFWRLPT